MSGIVVVGAAGGCGVTTLACGLALAGATNDGVPLLVDADPHGGGPVSLWSIEAHRRLDDLADLGADVGAEHMAHVVHRHPCGVDVLAGCTDLTSPVLHDTVVADALAQHVASRSSWVADGGRGDTRLCHELVRRAGDVVLVVPLTLHGASRASAVLSRLMPVTPVVVGASWVAGARVSTRAVARVLGSGPVLESPRDEGTAADIASARAARGRGLARVVAGLAAAR